MASLPARGRALLVVLLLALSPAAGCLAKVKDVFAPQPEEPIEEAELEDEEPPTPSTPPPRRPTPTPTPTTPPISTTPPPTPQPSPPAIVPQPGVVIAIIDTGINPYHYEFRDDSPLATVHPSLYIPGYPADARELKLTLNAGTLEDALKADNATWAAVEPGVLYWIPGTRIAGLVSIEKDGDHPGFDNNGHGTMTASRAAGRTTSLAPTARIVVVEGLGAPSVSWAASQSWIDVQSNSWVSVVPNPDAKAAFSAAATSQAVLVASGNGLGQLYGGVGQPALTGSNQGAPGVIVVGGHDNGQLTPWAGTMPHVVADACWNWAAVSTSLTETGPRVGTGTSSAAPYAAGAIAALVLDARRALNDATAKHEGGIFASGTASIVAEGPLSDGNFTLDEAKALLLATANPRPVATPHDGDLCGADMAPYVSGPWDWSAVPGELPAYYFTGYGAINVDSLVVAREVLAGRMVAPERSNEDAFREGDDFARSLIPV